MRRYIVTLQRDLGFGRGRRSERPTEKVEIWRVPNDTAIVQRAVRRFGPLTLNGLVRDTYGRIELSGQEFVR